MKCPVLVKARALRRDSRARQVPRRLGIDMEVRNLVGGNGTSSARTAAAARVGLWGAAGRKRRLLPAQSGESEYA